MTRSAPASCTRAESPTTWGMVGSSEGDRSFVTTSHPACLKYPAMMADDSCRRRTRGRRKPWLMWWSMVWRMAVSCEAI